MDRLACVNVPELPLQLLLREHSDWQGSPAVVVDEDHPQGVVLWANNAARAFRILPGLRYASAHALCADVRAGAVARARIEEALRELHTLLLRFSPTVEVLAEEPGIFWLDASGLAHIYPSLTVWGQELRQALQGASRVDGAVVVGFTRFGTYALAKTRRGVEAASCVTVLDSVYAEQRAAFGVRLDELDVDPKMRDTLHKLGVITLHDFVRLPPAGLAERFGGPALRLHRLASGDAWNRLFATTVHEAVESRLIFDHRETDTARLTFVIKAQLHDVLSRLAARHEALVALTVSLLLDDRTTRADVIRPATPTLDPMQIIELVRLRLESAALARPVIEVMLRADGVVATAEQLRIFTEHPRRNLDAAARALARLRAELGEDAVTRVALRDAHLPEAQYALVPADRIAFPRPLDTANRPLVRRFYTPAVPLPPRPRHERDNGWLVKGVTSGPATRVVGPHVVSGGWWMREVHREYHFVQLQNGELLWIYYDRGRRRWFLQGEIE